MSCKMVLWMVPACLSLMACTSVSVKTAQQSAETLRSPSSDTSPNYCLAIRGNGENVGAHWGAMGQLIESYGMPNAMAGGSSATITQFFIDSLARNADILREQDLEKRRAIYALLMKSLPRFFEGIAVHDEKISKAIGLYLGIQKQLLTKKINTKATPAGGSASKPVVVAARVRDLSAILAENPQIAKSAVDVASELLIKYGGLINSNIIAGLKSKNIELANFYLAEARKSVDAFGKFDAVNDEGLFFREGIIDFAYFSQLLGRVADMLAGLNQDMNGDLNDYINQCHAEARGKVYSEFSKACQVKWEALITAGLNQWGGAYTSEMLMAPIGVNIPSVPMTTLVTGRALTNFRALHQEYRMGKTEGIGQFTADFDDLKIGYWASEEQIETLRDNYSENERSQKAVALPRANWLTALTTSPAEPGLARFQYFNSVLDLDSMDSSPDAEYLSAGGWSDLAPTLVLEANQDKWKCNSIVYLSRQGGDSVFAQQLFVRILALQSQLPNWQTLDRAQSLAGVPKENVKDFAQNHWHKIYNIANPESSLRQDLAAATAVKCTNWDSFDLMKGQISAMVEDAYNAPLVLNPPYETAGALFATDGSTSRILNAVDSRLRGCSSHFATDDE